MWRYSKKESSFQKMSKVKTRESTPEASTDKGLSEFESTFGGGLIVTRPPLLSYERVWWHWQGLPPIPDGKGSRPRQCQPIRCYRQQIRETQDVIGCQLS